MGVARCCGLRFPAAPAPATPASPYLHHRTTCYLAARLHPLPPPLRLPRNRRARVGVVVMRSDRTGVKATGGRTLSMPRKTRGAAAATRRSGDSAYQQRGRCRGVSKRQRTPHRINARALVNGALPL